jgi:hypothetical protein
MESSNKPFVRTYTMLCFVCTAQLDHMPIKSYESYLIEDVQFGSRYSCILPVFVQLDIQ